MKIDFSSKKQTKKPIEKSTINLDIKNFIRDVGLVGVAEFAVAIGGLLLLPLLTKRIGAYGYGLYQQMLVTIGILSPIASFGLNNALVRFYPAKEKIEEKQELFYSIIVFKLFTSTIIAVLLLIFSKQISNALFGGANYIVVLTAFIFFISSSNIICQFYFRSIRQIKIYATIRVLDSYSKISFAYIMIILGKGIFGVILAYLLVEIFFTSLYLIIIFYQIGIKIPRFTNLKNWLKYGIPLIPTGLSLWIISFSDRYVIGYLMGIYHVGIYSAAYTIGFSFFMIMELINFVLVPTISKLYDNKKYNETKEYLGYVLKFYLLIAIPAVFGLIIFSKDILQIVTTSEIATSAWMITPIIGACTLFAGVSEVFDKTLRLTKKTSKIGLIITISAIINLVLNFSLIPIYGIMGAAVATILSYALSAFLMIYFSTKEFRFYIEIKSILKFFIASIVMALIGFIWNPVTFISLILCIFVCIGLYFILLFLLKAFNYKEIRFLIDAVLFKK